MKAELLHYVGKMKAIGLRDTEQRRLILEALSSLTGGADAEQIHTWIKKKNSAVNLVTVYRTLETFLREDLVHRINNGRFVLCTIPETHGHHGFLHCDSCSRIEEFHDESLCEKENAIARKAGFQPHRHFSELMGTCSTCR